MTLTAKTLLSAMSTTLLMACGGSTIEGDMVDTGPDPLPSTYLTSTQALNDRTFVNTGFGLDRTTPLAGVRNGTAYCTLWCSDFDLKTRKLTFYPNYTKFLFDAVLPVTSHIVFGRRYI